MDVDDQMHPMEQIDLELDKTMDTIQTIQSVSNIHNALASQVGLVSTLIQDPFDIATANSATRKFHLRVKLKPENATQEIGFNPSVLRIASTSEKRQKSRELIKLLNSLPILNSQKCLSTLNNLLVRFPQETTPSIMIQMVHILSHLALQPNVSSLPIVCCFLNIIVNSDSKLPSISKTIPYILDVLTMIMRTKYLDTTQVCELAWHLLSNSTTPTIRISAMSLLTTLVDISSPDMLYKIMKLALVLIHDGDGRVRVMAFQSIFELLIRSSFSPVVTFRNDNSLDLSSFYDSIPVTSTITSSPVQSFDLAIYNDAVSGIFDDIAQVRLEAMYVIWILSNMHFVHLGDDSFRKICYAVSDTDRTVRAKACALLGSLRGVSTQLMLQSLSKKLLRVDTTSFCGKVDPFDEIYQSSEDVDLIKFSSRNNIIDSSANGAFVHGLEDEFSEVRNATVDSICELSCHSEAFAHIATEFFIDIFNDDANEIRLNAVRALSKLGKFVRLTDGQVHVILSILDDASPTIRSNAQELLRSIQLPDIQCLRATMRTLLDSLVKYQDKNTTLLTLQIIAKKHAYFVELIVEELLKMDERFLIREPRLEDLRYVGIVTTLLNAATCSVNVMALLPPFLPRHYLYLKDKYPYVIQDMPKLVDFSSGKGDFSSYNGNINPKFNYTVRNNGDQFEDSSTGDILNNKALGNLTERACQLADSGFYDINQINRIFTQLKHELYRLSAHANSSFLALIEFYIDYSDIIKAVICIKNKNSTYPCQRQPGGGNSYFNVQGHSIITIDFLNQLVQQTYNLERCFSGFGFVESTHFKILRLFAHFELYVLRCQQAMDVLVDSVVAGSTNCRQTCYTLLINRLHEVIQICTDANLEISPDLAHLTEGINAIPEFGTLSSESIAKFQANLRKFPIIPLKFSNLIKLIQATIYCPMSDVQSHLRKNIIADYPLELTIESRVHNITNIEALMLCLTFSDHTSVLQAISLETVKQISPLSYDFEIKINIPPDVWMVNSFVEMALVKVYAPDIADNINFPLFELLSCKHDFYDTLFYTHISDVCKYCIYP